MASWLDTAFYNFDNAILSFWHSVALKIGSVATPVMEVISFFGYKGLMMILLGVILLLFKRTRKLGVGGLIAILLGFLITNLTVKNLVARARPYTHAEYIPWWSAVGKNVESDLSFPSGHTTVVTSMLTAIFLLSKNKKYTWICLIGVALMGASRNYLMVHYPTDVIGGIIVGLITSSLATVITNYLYKAFYKNADNGFCKFVLTACVTDLFKKK